MSWPREHQLRPQSVFNPNTQRRMNVLFSDWATRECGCGYAMGVELGSNEIVFTPAGCNAPGHTFAIEGAVRKLQEMPGQDEEVGQLFERVYEQLLPTFSVGA